MKILFFNDHDCIAFNPSITPFSMVNRGDIVRLYIAGLPMWAIECEDTEATMQAIHDAVHSCEMAHNIPAISWANQ